VESTIRFSSFSPRSRRKGHGASGLRVCPNKLANRFGQVGAVFSRGIRFPFPKLEFPNLHPYGALYSASIAEMPASNGEIEIELEKRANFSE
jgi:hypothetical protein